MGEREWDSWAPWDISIIERFPNPLLILTNGSSRRI
jgi:hypothetical protein